MDQERQDACEETFHCHFPTKVQGPLCLPKVLTLMCSVAGLNCAIQRNYIHLPKYTIYKNGCTLSYLLPLLKQVQWLMSFGVENTEKFQNELNRHPFTFFLIVQILYRNLFFALNNMDSVPNEKICTKPTHTGFVPNDVEAIFSSNNFWKWSIYNFVWLFVFVFSPKMFLFFSKLWQNKETFTSVKNCFSSPVLRSWKKLILSNQMLP